MEIYLAIIWTYLSFLFTIFLYLLFKTENVNKKLMEDNIEWKKEVREYFNNKK